MNRRGEWSWSAIGFVIFAAIVGTLVSRYVSRVADKVEGDFGYRPDPEGTAAFLAELEQPLFRQAGAEVIAGAKGNDAYLYRFADRAHRMVYGKPFGPLNQGSIGSCVGAGWAMGSFVGQAVDFATGAMEKPPLKVSIENIYAGSRTLGRSPPISFAGYGDGSFGAAAARYVSGVKGGLGGILYCQPYEGADLTDYSVSRCKSWGATGVPTGLAKVANEHTATKVALARTWQDAVSALESGLPVVVCSNVGFASGARDADGFCRRASTWNHCLCWIGVKYAKNSGKNGEPPMKNPRDGILVINSWGSSWLGGGKHPADQPDGSFWITRSDAEAILAQGDSFVIGSVSGFKYRDLEHANWMQPAPAPAEVASSKINHALAL